MPRDAVPDQAQIERFTFAYDSEAAKLIGEPPYLLVR